MEIIVKEPKDFDCDMKQWPARYAVLGAGEVRLVHIESRSAIDVVVAKIAENGFLGPQTGYYISSPNFGVASDLDSKYMDYDVGYFTPTMFRYNGVWIAALTIRI